MKRSGSLGYFLFMLCTSTGSFKYVWRTSGISLEPGAEQNIKHSSCLGQDDEFQGERILFALDGLCSMFLQTAIASFVRCG